MKKTNTTRYDVAEHLATPKEMAAYLDACLEEADGDAAFIAKALEDIARAKGMSQVAHDAGLWRESLYKAPSSDRSPGFDTILKSYGCFENQTARCTRATGEKAGLTRRGITLRHVVGGEARQRTALSEWRGILYFGRAVLILIAT